ncbi:rhomboid-domain-containing protein [Patellaria atrata CBS 101060]|uniref:Rhomboid-type serine protease n=1 Tax=Patellaria atrata CBS 101060 TaxID=1346257 RepID=A0A9P4SAN6_9PEZI|nr:rhomboid-domain-containing protein [Patellaria atrata CBS 101060]
MAANDYYTSFNPNSRRDDAPLPPASTSPQRPHVDTHLVHNTISPVTSPFSDNTYPAKPQNDFHTDSSYHGASSQYSSAPDPFADHNAIPMQHQNMKYDPNTSPIEAEGQYQRGGRHGRRRSRKKGWFAGRVPWMVYILTAAQIAVFIGSIIKYAVLTGRPIATTPQFNPMIGPSTPLLINMGALYQPCMRNTEGVQNSSIPVGWPCPGAKTNATECTLSELCGFGGVPNPHPNGSIDDKPSPNQWWRFIVPIFLHSGLIHITFNMLVQVTLAREIEQSIGSLRFALVYFASGIFGFVLGGNYAGTGVASMGASGALFGIIALLLLELLYSWRDRPKPLRDLAMLVLTIVIAFVLGLLPGLDNFSHIGGFLMGLVIGICILHSPNALRERAGMDEPPYNPVTPGGRVPQFASVKAFARQPVGFFIGRKPWWWAWWLVRVGALVGALVGFIALLQNFYVHRSDCDWCKYLSCIPVNDWCEQGVLRFQETPSKRDLFAVDRARMLGMY